MPRQPNIPNPLDSEGFPPRSEDHQYPSPEARDRAERAANELFTRYQEAMVRLHRITADSAIVEVSQSLRTVADLSSEVCRLLALGWHHDQPF